MNRRDRRNRASSCKTQSYKSCAVLYNGNGRPTQLCGELAGLPALGCRNCVRSSSSRRSSRWTRTWSHPSALPIFCAASRLQSSDQHAPSATGTRRRRMSPSVTADSCATASTASATRWQLCWQSGSRRRSSSDAACAMARAWRPCHSAIACAQPSGILALQATAWAHWRTVDSTSSSPAGEANTFTGSGTSTPSLRPTSRARLAAVVSLPPITEIRPAAPSSVWSCRRCLRVTADDALPGANGSGRIPAKL
jgi:hypothetical protein